MKQQSYKAMETLTFIGTFIAVVISIIIYFGFGDYTYSIPFICLGFFIIFRLAGWAIDRSTDKNNK